MDGLESKMVKFGEMMNEFFGSEASKAVFPVMKKWNQLKDDMQDGRLIPEYGERNADNLARAGAGIAIGQMIAEAERTRGKEYAEKLEKACLSLSYSREMADTLRKALHGKNMKETLNDASKDQDNIFRAIELGRQNPDSDPYALLATLNLQTNTFQAGYDNGYAGLIKEKYILGGHNKPVLTKEQGIAVNRMIKTDKTCASFAEAYKCVLKAEQLVAAGKSKDFSSALAMVEPKKVDVNTLLAQSTKKLKDTMQKETKKQQKLLADNTAVAKKQKPLGKRKNKNKKSNRPEKSTLKEVQKKNLLIAMNRKNVGNEL